MSGPVVRMRDEATVQRRPPVSMRQRLTVLMALIAVLGLGSGAVVLSMVTLVTSANSKLTTTLVPLQADTTELNLLYREQAANPVGAEILRARIRRLAALTSPAVAQQFAVVEEAADAWVATVTLPGDTTDVSSGEAQLLALRRALTTMMAEVTSAINRQRVEATDAARVAQITAAAATVGFLALAVAGAVLIRRWIAVPVEQLTRQVDGASGDLSQPITPGGPSELASIGEAVESMRRRLLDLASHRVDSALISGHEAERARIAGQIHDDQIQAMTLASIRLQQLRQKLRDDPDATALVASAQEGTNGAIARLRRMIFELHSPSLETDGLEAAVDEYLDETFGDDVSWSVDGEPGPLSPGIAALAFRLAREAMFNIFKHAHARTINVSLVRAPATITVSIRDDGIGFDGSDIVAQRGHLGFDHSRQLAAAAGGSWTCQSKPGEGTIVRFTLPTGADDLQPGGERKPDS